jgi:hypothetical protein
LSFCNPDPSKQKVLAALDPTSSDQEALDFYVSHSALPSYASLSQEERQALFDKGRKVYSDEALKDLFLQAKIRAGLSSHTAFQLQLVMKSLTNNPDAPLDAMQAFILNQLVSPLQADPYAFLDCLPMLEQVAKKQDPLLATLTEKAIFEAKKQLK